MKPNRKPAVVLAFFAGLSLLYAYWPEADSMADYRLKRCQADPAQQQEIRRILNTIRTYCEKRDFKTLERGFIHTQQERRIARELDGCDPVAQALELLRQHAAELQWEEERLSSFEQNRKRVEVVLPLKSSKGSLRLTFRHKGRSFFLVNIEQS